MADSPRPTSPPSALAQMSCFPTSSRSPVAAATPSTMTYPKSCLDTFLRELGFDTSDEFNTLAIPLAIAHARWSPTCEKHGRQSTHSGTKNASAPQQQHSSCTSCSRFTHFRNAYKGALAQTTKYGKAYERCSREMHHFLKWDWNHSCFSVDEMYQAHVDTKLKEFGYYEDATGKQQDRLIPKYSSFTMCQNGHRTPPAPANSSLAASPGKTSAKQMINTAAAKSASNTPAGKAAASPAAGSITATQTPVKQAQTAATTQTPASVDKPAATLAATQASTPATSSGTKLFAEKSSAPGAEPAAKTIAAKQPANTTSSSNTASTKAKQKKPEQVQSSSLLSDCRRFTSFCESNDDQRAHLSPQATLSETIHALNRAILSFGIGKLDNYIYAELAGIVALLNYAAAFYINFADQIESYMQDRLGNKFVYHFFRTVYWNRAYFIEMEEWRSSGSADAGGKDATGRDKRRQAIENESVKMVPDVTDLRDGVQTVLFTFVWVNYTAYQGFEAAMATTLHTLIPLLQTIVVRCARQAHLMHRALTVARCMGNVNKVPTPGAHDLQWDLLDLSAALQNLSGCDLALFTSSVYSSKNTSVTGSNGAKKKKTWNCNESVVSCPYTVHLYTAAVADMTFRTLLQLIKATESGVLAREPKPLEKTKCSQGCHCLSLDNRLLPIIEEMGKRLKLIERKQYDWRPKMMKPKKGRKKKNEAEESEEMVKNGRVLMLKEILSRRIEELRITAKAGQEGSVAPEPVNKMERLDGAEVVVESDESEMSGIKAELGKASLTDKVKECSEGDQSNVPAVSPNKSATATSDIPAVSPSKTASATPSIPATPPSEPAIATSSTPAPSPSKTASFPTPSKFSIPFTPFMSGHIRIPFKPPPPDPRFFPAAQPPTPPCSRTPTTTSPRILDPETQAQMFVDKFKDHLRSVASSRAFTATEADTPPLNAGPEATSEEEQKKWSDTSIAVLAQALYQNSRDDTIRAAERDM
ncbi:uncharacterized protein UTRI_04466_B [Ustilago trichophora]|uniref:Uncharacterized protein n=1 Tax=Ustilago trichophora TaxID=86804 RepID=A0A5C3EEK2_9BASI|nr:uncharacterized protein UTRI_04466_B [Ustilago trichophora]